VEYAWAATYFVAHEVCGGRVWGIGPRLMVSNAHKSARANAPNPAGGVLVGEEGCKLVFWAAVGRTESLVFWQSMTPAGCLRSSTLPNTGHSRGFNVRANPAPTAGRQARPGGPPSVLRLSDGVSPHPAALLRVRASKSARSFVLPATASSLRRRTGSASSTSPNP